MVGHYPTIKLIGREHIPHRKNFPPPPMPKVVISGINPGFPELSRSEGQITHVLLTRSPLEYHRSGLSARLACVKHAASVRPEPGSNSPSKNKESYPDQNKSITDIKARQSTCLLKETHTQKGHGAKTNKPIHRLNDTLLSSQTSDAHALPPVSRRSLRG